MRPIIDAHLDLAWNATSFDRDLTLPLDAMRVAERDMEDCRCRGRATVSLPELSSARVLVAIATLLARGSPHHRRQRRYLRVDLDYATQAGSFAAARAQRAWYELMERQGQLRILHTRGELAAHWQEQLAVEPTADAEATGELGESPKLPRLGVILSMEGADPISTPDELAWWWEDGLRLLGLSHYGFGRAAAGTGVDGPLTDHGLALLRAMEDLGMVLDVTHLSDTSMRQALDVFSGPVIASHHNSRSLVPGDRQLTDDQIKALVHRGAVIGAACDAWMLYAGWERGVTQPDVVSMEAIADHVDHICQLAGSAKHVGIGSDLDGGFGNEQTPRDLKRLTDLHRLEEILERRGYSGEDLDAFFFGNWYGLLMRVLPES